MPSEIPTVIYNPYGAARTLLAERSAEVLLDGPAGTGKSMACLHKLYGCAEKYRGMRGLMLRKFRANLTDSALVTWEEKVLPRNHPCLRGPKRTQRHIYYFPNGSTVTVAGLDDPDKQKSSEYDLVYVQEATELTEDDLTPVVRGMRNGKMVHPVFGVWHQIMMDCNPAEPTHWLKKRFERGQTVRLQSFHEDNPELFEHDENGNATTITEKGRAYLAELEAIPNITDMRRLRYGEWAGAEGRVYDGWDAVRHVIKPFRLPTSWPRYLGLDFGGKNTAALFYAMNPDTDQLICYREYHPALARTASQHITFLMEDEPVMPFCVGGAKAEGQWRMEFTTAGLRVHEPRIRSVEMGISRVNAQHKKNGILVFDTCTGYLEEKENYRYLAGAADPEAIERKRHYHYMDAERYIVGYLRPEATIVHLSPGRNGVGTAARLEA